ncbi:MAG: hypothetical protein ABR548_04680 [Actinomycetota bacterium]
MAAWLLTPIVSHGIDCVISGPLGTYQVRKWSLPTGGVFTGIDWQVQTPTQPPPVDDRGYHWGMAAFVYNPATGQTPLWVVDYAGDDAPHMVLTAGDADVVNAPIPVTAGIQGDYHEHADPYLDPGTYWVIAFGFGPDHGVFDALNPSKFRVAFNYGTAPCTESVSVPAQIVNYNNADFNGGTHVYAPGAEFGKDTTLSFDVSEKKTFGMVYNASTAGVQSGKYSIPGCNNCGLPSNSLFKMTSWNGHYSFTRTLQAGIDSSFDVDFLQLTLPGI